MITLLENTDAISYVLDDDRRILLHVVNCQGVMGSGIALQVKNRLPDAHAHYMEAFARGDLQLGTISGSASGSCANLAAQDTYGREKRQLNYGALSKCLSNLGEAEPWVEVVVPYLMGCDRAGGDWEIVSEILEFHCGEITVCKFGG